MSICGCGLIDGCQCSDKAKKRVWRPSLTVDRACQLVHSLLKSADCKTNCPDWELCRLIKFQCELCGGRYPVGTLAILAAAQLLETEAITFARRGSLKTLTITYDGNKSADVLMKIAKSWRENALACAPKKKSFGIVAVGKSCLSYSSAYSACGCEDYIKHQVDEQIITGCNWDCCEDGDCD